MSEKSIYDQIGGKKAVNLAVENFYEKVIADERVMHFFGDVDMAQQKAKQRAFLAMVFGGPTQYTGHDMRKGHAHLVERGLNDTHVDTIIELLGQTLRELNVPEPLIGQVAQIAESVRDDVLNRRKVGGP
jgi:hemoglobin